MAGVHHQPLQPETVTQLARRARLVNATFMHQRHAGATLGFIQIRRRDYDRHPLAREIRQSIPELAPRNRIHTGGGLIQQQDLWFNDQSARERELLLHAAAEFSRQPITEPIHIEHAEVTPSATFDLGVGQPAQLAHVAQILGHA